MTDDAPPPEPDAGAQDAPPHTTATPSTAPTPTLREHLRALPYTGLSLAFALGAMSIGAFVPLLGVGLIAAAGITAAAVIAVRHPEPAAASHDTNDTHDTASRVRLGPAVRRPFGPTTVLVWTPGSTPHDHTVGTDARHCVKVGNLRAARIAPFAVREGAGVELTADDGTVTAWRLYDDRGAAALRMLLTSSGVDVTTGDGDRLGSFERRRHN